MKHITINVQDERVDQLLKLLDEHDFDWKSQNEIPQWQIDEVEKRSKDAVNNPEIMKPWEEVKNRLKVKLG